MKRVLIVGCGYVGQPLAKGFLDEGANVWALQRRAVNIPGLKNIEADIVSVTENRLPEVDLVYYLISPQSSEAASYLDVYDKGLNKLITALRAKNNPKLIFCSSTRVYGQHQGEEVDEDSVTAPLEPLGQILLAGEKSALAYANSMVVRFGGIYGPHRTKLLDDILNHKVTLSPTAVYTNRIHLDDCVGMMRFLGDLKATGATFLGVDSEPVLYNEMIIWLASKLNAPHPVMGERPPLRLMNSNKRCMNRKIVSCGYRFHFNNYKEGYLNILHNPVV